MFSPHSISWPNRMPLAMLAFTALALVALPVAPQAGAEPYGSTAAFFIEEVQTSKDMEGRPHVEIHVEYGQIVFCPVASEAEAKAKAKALVQQQIKDARMELRYEPLGEGMMDALRITTPELKVDCLRRH